MTAPPPRDLIPAPRPPAVARSTTPLSVTISFEGDEPGPDERAASRTPKRPEASADRSPPVLTHPLAGKGPRAAVTPASADKGSLAVTHPLAGKGPRSAVTPTTGRAQARGAAAPVSAEGKQIRLLPGRRVPGTRYRLIRWLGEGGMGVVYEAEHEDIERRVALKILRLEATEDPQLAAQFRDEARAASRIGAPNIVEIFDFGELPDGRLMFAMELLNGHGLDSELDRCPMDQARMIAILRQVCKGLAAAHEVGIVHRDVKPDNIILISHGGRGDWVKVVDFGIATVHAETDAGAAGTPHYMAPEQVLGQPFDGRLDMYSFGCTAYELLAGKPPFVAPTIEEILEHQLHRAPRPLAEVCPPGAVHPALEAVILRCLEKDPARRYRDMRDVEAALCEAQIEAGLQTPYDDLPLPEVDAERLERLRREMPRPGVARPRRRWLRPAAAAAAGFVALVLALALWFMPDEPAPEEHVLVDSLVSEARAAGARARWVYPPEDRPDETALIKVRALEDVRGSARALARGKASELRQEFAQALVRLGDRYWDLDGGRPFARDYYIQAVMFDPGHLHARERSGVTPGFMSDLEDRAMAGEFTAGELRNTNLLVALAEPDLAARDRALLEFVARADSTSLVLAASAERLALATTGQLPQPPAPAPTPAPAPAPEETFILEEGAAAEALAGDPPAEPRPTATKASRASKKRDRKRSNKHAPTTKPRSTR